MSSIEEQVIAYLDGELSAKETRAFERELIRPEVSQALGEELALREMLQSLPVEPAPEALAARIEDMLGISEKKSLRAKLFGSRTDKPQALDDTAKEQDYAAAGLRVGMDSWLGGLSTLRYAAGPLAGAPEQLSQRALELARPSKPTGRSVLGMGRTALDAATSTVKVVRSVSKLPQLTRVFGFGKGK